MLTLNDNAITNVASITDVPWQILYQEDGIILQSWGEGTDLVVFPGLEGSGESCLHLVLPVMARALSINVPFRLILVNYAQERHATLADLIASIDKGLTKSLGSESCIFWAQSFGNLLATGVLQKGSVSVKKLLMVSPFTRLPSLLTRMSAASLALTPTFLYRATIKPLGRYVFGPVGENARHPFFQALARATTPEVRRQTKWLVNQDFNQQYEAIAIPAKAWLGDKDRLVNLPDQLKYFKDLASRKPNLSLSVIPDSGHVVFPNKVVAFMKEELYQWLLDKS
jgi:pimeloyl-ACP methyl ester carboxylesterase